MSVEYKVENGIKYIVHTTRHGIFWYLYGRLTRDVGPAVEYIDGTKVWYKNNNRHREDGPAVEKADGTKIWYLHGIKLKHMI